MVRANDVLEIRFDSISNNLSDNFVLGVVETNRPKVSKGSDILALRNQAQVSGVHPGIHRMGSEGLDTQVYKEGSYYVPIFLLHERVETIRTRGFGRFEGEDNTFNFSIRKEGIQ